MGSVGDCFGNAMCKSFFATLECELLARCRFKTQVEARTAVFEFIEKWYNPGGAQIRRSRDTPDAVLDRLAGAFFACI